MPKRVLKKPHAVVPDPETTKSKLILAGAQLFARDGYSDVSIRDIAREAGIKSASIYNHFSSKQEILESIMEYYEKELYQFYNMLDELSAKANSLLEILQNIFAEVQVDVNPFSYNACWCAVRTQYNFEASRHLYHDVFFDQGRVVMRRQLEIAVERGLVKPFDVDTCGAMITNCVIMSIGFHVGKINGFYEDLDLVEWCRRTIKQILYVAGEDVPEGW